jgi:DNA-binding NtrC family response regulator
VRRERSLTLLVVDDDTSIRRIFTDLIRGREGVAVREAGDAEQALSALRDQAFDVAFVDVRMPGTTGMDLLERLRKERPALEVVMMTAHGTIESAVQAMKLGASDYLSKPFRLEQVSLILERLGRVKDLQAENARLRKELQGRYAARNVVGHTPSIERCNALIDRVRQEDCNVLILGESGTGKELIARAIHYDGVRHDRLFVPIDCGAMQASLLESELFGHEKGAFTGAHVRKAGLFEIASGGTVFLDEIGEIPLDLQPALLRAIEEKEIRPVGATGYRTVDVRIIAATNRPLEEMVAQGRFRRDLYYRLNVVTIQIPSLRERKDDVPLLAEHFLRQYAARGARKLTGLSRDALFLLQRYDWPGNVRELQHVIERACALGQADRVELDDLPPAILQAVEAKSRGAEPGGVGTLEEMERAAIARLLEECAGDTARAAEALGIDRSTLYRKAKRYKLAIPVPRRG